jgi:hypothetical protein
MEAAYRYYKKRIGQRISIKGSAFNKKDNKRMHRILHGKILQVHQHYVLVKFNESHTEGFHFTQLKGSENFCRF